ncbi:MAG TPA: hypothetical protein VHU87_11885 [Rhizomicrobium sp.]|jgi:hypothetical protein|nr:hypothetical protein [Rhizomicrobium sp.]
MRISAIAVGVALATLFAGPVFAQESAGWPFTMLVSLSIEGKTAAGAESDPIFTKSAIAKHEATLFCHETADAIDVNCEIQLTVRVDDFTYVPTKTNIFMQIAGLPPLEPAYNLMASWNGNFGGIYTNGPGQISMDTNATHNDPSGKGSVWWVTASFSDYDAPTNCTWGASTFVNWCKLGGADSSITTPHIRMIGNINMTTSMAQFTPWMLQGIARGVITPISALPPEYAPAAAKRAARPL